MKIKNRKTGEIVETDLYFFKPNGNWVRFHNIKELNNEWVDYE